MPYVWSLLKHFLVVSTTEIYIYGEKGTKKSIFIFKTNLKYGNYLFQATSRLKLELLICWIITFDIWNI